MPQKKNPDVPELVRGKTGRVVGDLVGAADADEGPAARVQQGQPGGQGAAVRHRRHARRHARDHDRPRRDRHPRRRGADARGGARGLRHRDRPRRLPGAARACRSATRTRRSRARCATPRRRASTSPTLPLAELRRSRRRSATTCSRVLTLEGSVASRDHPGGTAPAQVRAAIAAARAALRPRMIAAACRGRARLRRRHADDDRVRAAGLRIVQTRSAHDISWWMFGIFSVGVALWLWYGIGSRAAADRRQRGHADAALAILCSSGATAATRDRAPTRRRNPRSER